jgi:hypothetical protein
MRYQNNPADFILNSLLTEAENYPLNEDAASDAEKEAIEKIAPNLQSIAKAQRKYHNARLDFYNEVKDQGDKASKTMKKLAGVDTGDGKPIEKFEKGDQDVLPSNLEELLKDLGLEGGDKEEKKEEPKEDSEEIKAIQDKLEKAKSALQKKTEEGVDQKVLDNIKKNIEGYEKKIEDLKQTDNNSYTYHLELKKMNESLDYFLYQVLSL